MFFLKRQHGRFNSRTRLLSSSCQTPGPVPDTWKGKETWKILYWKSCHHIYVEKTFFCSNLLIWSSARHWSSSILFDLRNKSLEGTFFKYFKLNHQQQLLAFLKAFFTLINLCKFNYLYFICQVSGEKTTPLHLPADVTSPEAISV